jgi:formylglycine-generating enzyme required for sulfatase activity
VLGIQPASPRGRGEEDPTPVGAAAKIDLAGNVEEWTLDFYVVPYAAGSCVDCAYLIPTMLRAVRGDSFFVALMPPLPAQGDAFEPSGRTGFTGFRCARSST